MNAHAEKTHVIFQPFSRFNINSVFLRQQVEIM